ncbi:MAG: hypothetical protein CME68_12125 [Halobacteriovoraceae bacterium]|nr:hypothetical protein [Halobacteriovoraceae bacterium]|tara:strand:+ start:1312 stop:2001 length:690 start_codon:yes stop_codon:yes gene_type:complete
MKVLVIDDDKSITYSLKKVLLSVGMEPFIAENWNQASDLILKEKFGLILLDICLGSGKNGFNHCKELRTNPKTMDTPIIIISALWDYEDKIQGLELGADDFVCKPFNKGELIARINAVCRRSGGTKVIYEESDQFNIGNLDYNKKSFSVKIGESEVHLTKKEHQILYEFLKSPGELISKNDLIGLIWGIEQDHTKLFDVHLINLRKKIQSWDYEIKTKFGLGMILEERL